MDSPNDSNNSIAKRLGVSDVTVAKVRSELGLSTENVVGADGKTYKSEKGKIVKQFEFNPFTILDASTQKWLDRKSWWRSWGIESEIGRNATAFGYATGTDPVSIKMQEKNNHISLFDPVLTELMITWHTNENDLVYDPFAGGPVRGIVTAALGRKYVGCEIRTEQVDANKLNANALSTLSMFDVEHHPKWVLGDANEIEPPQDIDFVFTCPPYFNLEIYSDLDGDLSNQTEEQFIKNYESIIERSVKNLKKNSFCAFVVGNVRRSNGSIFDMSGLTVRSMEKAGIKFYADYVLRTPVGGSAVRIPQFAAGRKPIRLHQIVIVGVRGDGIKAAKAHPIKINESN
jgi:DNA modification methylase